MIIELSDFQKLQNKEHLKILAERNPELIECLMELHGTKTLDELHASIMSLKKGEENV